MKHAKINKIVPGITLGVYAEKRRMIGLTDEEKPILRSIFHDLQLLFEKNEIRSDEIDGVLQHLQSEEAKSYINSLKEAKPESALSDSFFAGRSILKKYIFETATPEAVVGDGFIDFKARIGEKIILVELKPLFESKTKKVKAGKELISLRQIGLNPQDHKAQILKYIREGGEYIILTNLKEWFFFNRSVTAAEFEPFATTDLMEFRKEFEVERNLWDYLTRLDRQSIREDLDVHFFKSLQMWVGKLSEVEFCVDKQRQTELIINLINKFLFIQTLDDYRVIEPRWIQETWEHNERRWANKGKGKVLTEFFKDVDSWFYQYYDTELFRNSILDQVNQSDRNFELLHKNLRLVLGLEYWMSAFGGFRGIMQYNFRYIDEDILGKAYETFLAGVRHDEGIYYTPKYITQYIVENTIGTKLEVLVGEISAAITKEDFDKTRELVTELISIRVLDPACGSGSFLIKATRKVLQKYTEVQNLLLEIEERHNKFQGSLYRPQEIEEKVEKIEQLIRILGPRNKRELIARILVRHIHGNDKDKKALDVAKVNIWLEAIKLSPADFRYDRLPSETNYILPDLEMNFCNGDSVVGLPEDLTVELLHSEHKNDVLDLSQLRSRYLNDPSDPQLVDMVCRIKRRLKDSLDERFKEYLSEKDLPTETVEETIPFHWALGFWYFYFDERGDPLPREDRGVHIIVGNPPYERIQVLRKKASHYVEYLNGVGFNSALKNYDLAVVFMEKGLSLITRDGEFGYIVTNKFMKTDYGEGIREVISQAKALKELISFGHQQVFDDATTYTAIVFLRKNRNERVRCALIKKLKKTVAQLSLIQHNSALSTRDEDIFELNLDSITKEPWVLAGPAEQRILSKLAKYPRLSFGSKRIFQGLVTGADSIFILEPLEDRGDVFKVYSKSLGKECMIEKALLKPFLYGRNMQKWLIPSSESLVLFPYKITEGRAYLLEKEELAAEYPRAWKYLNDNREGLENRERGKWKGIDYWYALGRRQNLEQFDQPKIMTQVLAYRAAFSIDEDSHYYFAGAGGSNGYGITLEADLSLKYCCGVLNSSLLDWNLKKVSTSHRGGYWIYAKRFLDKLPLRKPSKQEIDAKNRIETLVEKILEYKQAEREYRELWNHWSTKLKESEYHLWRILENDFRSTQEGAFEATWTSDVTFYPSQEQAILLRGYNQFRAMGDKESNRVKIFGMDESNREELVYTIDFRSIELMEHCYTAIFSLLDSRKVVKNLSDILLKTVIPIITPNPLQQTPNIVKKVRMEFAEWKKHKNLVIEVNSLAEIQEMIKDTEAKLDALVFLLYELEKDEVKIILDSLLLSLAYQESVIEYFDEFSSTCARATSR